MNRISEILETLKEENRFRRIPEGRGCADVTDLCSNDYMGLARREGEFREEFRMRFGDAPMTSSASRILASDQHYYTLLESYLSEAYGKEALLFNSGYHANVGALSALSIPSTLFLADRLVHASAIDGMMLNKAEFKRWKHNDTASLRKLLEENHGKYERIIVVCESVYSMDGDIAPLKEIAAMKDEYPEMMLYVDEAHGLGCFGERGLGVCEEEGLIDKCDILIGTLGKACASSGAFAVCGSEMRDFLVNRSRSLIFSTCIAPVNAAWSLLMLEKLSGMNEERRHLAGISRRFREGVERITGKQNPSRSAIVPLVTGDAAKAIGISDALRENGVLALPIRRPTVPPGGERIRFSLNASLTAEDIDRLLDKIENAYTRQREG